MELMEMVELLKKEGIPRTIEETTEDCSVMGLKLDLSVVESSIALDPEEFLFEGELPKITTPNSLSWEFDVNRTATMWFVKDVGSLVHVTSDGKAEEGYILFLFKF